MHRSMKSGPHSVSAGLKTEESAARQMDKAEWLGKRKKRGNAKSIAGHRQFGLDSVSHELTLYAESLSEKEWQSASAYHALALNQFQFLVFTRAPDTHTHIGPRTRFLRVRKVIISAREYASCSCGFMAEYKMPCRHLFRVIGCRQSNMYALRWMLCYQHGFDRDRFSAATETMRELLVEEHGRNFDCSEHIVCGVRPKMDDNTRFPIGIDGSVVGAEPMTDDLVHLGLLLYSYRLHNMVLVRGKPLPEQPPGDALAAMDMMISHSETVTEMLSQDIVSLQKDQEETVRARIVRKDTFANKCIDVVKQTLKLTEESPSLRREYLEYLEEARDKYQLEVLPASSRNRHSRTENEISFPPSTDYAVERVKRKGR